MGNTSGQVNIRLVWKALPDRYSLDSTESSGLSRSLEGVVGNLGACHWKRTRRETVAAVSDQS